MSLISVVMSDCRALLNSKDRILERSLALSDAFFIATILAECSEAIASYKLSAI
jgi:hypothetical protein